MPFAGGRSLRGVTWALVIATLVVVSPRLAPQAPLRSHMTFSTAVYADGGELLRLTLAQDEQYRLWVPIDQIAPKLQRAVLLYEDRWFFWHPGFNPFALARSALSTYGGGRRQGGSTMTMQLARRLYGVDSRTLPGKLKQIACAVWLELRYGKREILEAHLNLAPFGGNVEGVGAASLVYFHKRAAALTLPEALTLAVIPQNPRRRTTLPRDGHAPALPPELAEARERLWRRWLAQHPDDQRFAADLALLFRPKAPAELPFRAPHVAEALLRTAARGDREIWSTIDLRLQTTLERMVRQYVERGQSVGILNATAILVDGPTMEVKALVGSANYFDDKIDGQVNGVFAKRSPGSTLKPFIYALALDQGVLHPMTVLKDLPTAFGPFSPENFDGRFVGPISAEDALIRSRNVPAVWVAARLSQPGLYQLLKSAGVANMASEKHYGLALALGGGDMTPEELARLYAMLANRGLLRPLRYRRETARGGDGARMISNEAAFITLDMLRKNPRPDTGLPAVPPVAWKTGTSWGFRDAWSAGVFGRYLLVVWIGNFDGGGNPAFIGVKAAAPLFFQIVDSIRGQGLDPGEPIRTIPANLARVQVCAASGDLPNAYCRERARTWFIPGKSPIRVSTLHRPLLIDTRTGRAACEESAFTRREIFEFWPSDMLRLFREAGMPRREPPRTPECERSVTAADGDTPQITSPLRGTVYTMRISRPTTIELRATCAGCGGGLYWFANRGFLGQANSGESLTWSPPQAGQFVVRVVDEAGRADAREISVDFLP